AGLDSDIDQPSQAGAIAAIIDGAGHNSLHIRRSFVQDRDLDDQPRPGRLAALIGAGRNSTFDQYLLLLAWAQRGQASLCLDWRIWARLLGLPLNDAARRTIGRNWKILSDLNLVAVSRRGRQTSATAQCEDGSGKPYERPDLDGARCLELDHRYWNEDYHKRLTVPGKAVMLIALTLGDWFALPTRRGPQWYGISRSTLERGFKNAYECAVLGTRFSLKQAPLAPKGYTKQNHYILLAPFGPRGIVASTAPPHFHTNWPTPKRVSKKRRKRRGKAKLPGQSSEHQPAIEFHVDLLGG
ncbi:MAG TPA: hypothetical protein VID48_03890, partial [Solirubrobacteraceae bacterium]